MNINCEFSLINLPSKGKYYKNGASTLFIRHLNSFDERMMSNHAVIETEHGIKALLGSIILNDDFDVEELLEGDAQAIALLIHSVSFGDKLKTTITCPSCKFEEEKEILISNIGSKKVKELPKEGTRIFEIQLPVTKKLVKIKVATFLELFRFKKEHSSFLENLAFLIDGIDEEISGYDNILGAIRNLPIKDSRFLKSFLDENTPGIESKISHQCSKCSHKFDVKMGSGYNLFKLPEEYYSNVIDQLYFCSEQSENLTWQSLELMSNSTRKYLIKRLQEKASKMKGNGGTSESEKEKITNRIKRARVD